MMSPSPTPDSAILEKADACCGKDELAEAIANLSPEEREVFFRALDLAMKKRRVLLVGNLLAALVIIVGMLWALYMYGGNHEGFIGWVFLVPFAAAGLTMIVSGKLAKRIGTGESP